jgi:uncharacterized protein YndB with AHSA1/START domain
VKEYDTGSRINAAPETVWRILTDAAGYASWNPEIVDIQGSLAANARITARVKVGGGAIRGVSMRVTTFVTPSLMVWVGGLPLGLFTGTRTFSVTPRDGGTEFHMHLRMAGPLSGLIEKSVGDRQPEIDSFSAALKTRAES